MGKTIQILNFMVYKIKLFLIIRINKNNSDSLFSLKTEEVIINY